MTAPNLASVPLSEPRFCITDLSQRNLLAITLLACGGLWLLLAYVL